MRPHRRRLTIAIILVFVSTYLALYTVMAHVIAARHIYEDTTGGIWWRTTSGGSLLPWPREPGMLEALSKVDEVDLFVYRYLIKSWILVGLSVLTWIGTGLYMYKVKLDSL